MPKIKIVPKKEVYSWLNWLNSERPGPVYALLFIGDRINCVDKVAVAIIDENIAGLATIAPNGEADCGEPTIVALYVLKEHRQTGLGLQLLEAAINYMIDEGLTPIHIDALTTTMLRLAGRVTANKQQCLNVVDQSGDGSSDALLES
jgi:GNAT superfamily N-acetyltransferase